MDNVDKFVAGFVLVVFTFLGCSIYEDTASQREERNKEAKILSEMYPKCVNYYNSIASDGYISLTELEDLKVIILFGCK